MSIYGVHALAHGLMCVGKRALLSIAPHMLCLEFGLIGTERSLKMYRVLNTMR